MEIRIQKKFLVFPIHAFTEDTELRFLENGETVYKLNLRPNAENPDFCAYIDVGRFRGKTLRLLTNPETSIVLREADEIEGDFDESMRPQIHFTPKNGWLNDPNGLIYENGTYHIFYQYNPCDTRWQNMHWGHAVSRDLLHWEEKDTALFPDGRGMMYSGCAISDERNLLGKNKEKPAAVLFYTTTEPFAQNISYSTDHFKTIRHFKGNPVIPHICAKNRDPKVVFCKELDAYIMALFMEEERFCLFTSADLVHWETLREIELAGDGECPDIFPLTADDGSRKWVFMGAKDRYLVGEFKDGRFVPCQSVESLHYGKSAYAGQSFSGLPDGRVVRLTWQRTDIPNVRFNGQMGVPLEMSLTWQKDRYYLAANPIGELCSLYKSSASFSDIIIDTEHDFSAGLEDTPYRVRLQGAYGKGRMILSIFGREIRLDFAENKLFFGDFIAPLSVEKADFDFTAVIDNSGMEIFLDGGKAYLACTQAFARPDRERRTFSIRSDCKNTAGSLSFHALSSIWERET